MNTQKKIQHSLNDLIEIARDGHDFYTEAAGKVKDAELSALFMRIAGVKQDIVTRLSAAPGQVLHEEALQVAAVADPDRVELMFAAMSFARDHGFVALVRNPGVVFGDPSPEVLTGSETVRACP